MSSTWWCSATVSYNLSGLHRFAEFVEGSSHLTQEEVIAYSYHETDDEDLDVDIDVDNMNNTRHNGSDEEEMLVDAQHMTEDEGSDRE